MSPNRISMYTIMVYIKYMYLFYLVIMELNFTSIIICFIQVTRKQGQFGIISCIAVSPENNGLYACGSFSKSGIVSY